MKLKLVLAFCQISNLDQYKQDQDTLYGAIY